MQQRHLLGARPHRRNGTVLDEQLQEASVVQDGLVDGVVLVLDEVDLVRARLHQMLDALPGAPLARDVQQRFPHPERHPRFLHLLGQDVEDVDLVAVDGVADRVLQLRVGPLADAHVVALIWKGREC